eukprot:gene28387-18943_t
MWFLGSAFSASGNAGKEDPFAKHFDESCGARLHTGSQTRPYMKQPDFVAAIKEIQENGDALSRHLGDIRIRVALKVLSGIDLGGAAGRCSRASTLGRWKVLSGIDLGA